MSEEKLVPKLRFSGFDDEWKKCKLKEISNIQDGTHATPNYTDEGIPFYSVETITSDAPPKFISNEEHQKLIKRCEPKFGDILLTRIGTLAKSKIVDWHEEFSIYVSLALLSEIKINNKFLNQYIQTEIYQKEFLKRSLLLAIPQKINLKDLNETIIKYPSKKEEEKIANFLDLIDKKIELLTHKYKKYVSFKKYLMQQIFTQKLRFDENCVYETKKVGNFLIESKIEGIDNINKRLTVKLNLKGIFKREVKANEVEGATKQFIRKAGQFIYGKQNLHKGAFGIIPKEFDGYLTSTDIPSFDFKGEINKNWFYYYFSRKSFYENLEKLSTGTGSKRVSPKEFLNIKILIPEIEEQNNITILLENIDKNIWIISKQISYMDSFKKGLLQQMFV